MENVDGELVSLYTDRNRAMNSGNRDGAMALNKKINDYIAKNKISKKVRQNSSVAASNVKGDSKGGLKTKKVPVISIGVGMAEFKKDPSKKAKMMRGGMANKKEHMYSNGGSVTDNLNPGLRALQKERPDVVAKILKKS